MKDLFSRKESSEIFMNREWIQKTLIECRVSLKRDEVGQHLWKVWMERTLSWVDGAADQFIGILSDIFSLSRCPFSCLQSWKETKSVNISEKSEWRGVWVELMGQRTSFLGLQQIFSLYHAALWAVSCNFSFVPDHPNK